MDGHELKSNATETVHSSLAEQQHGLYKNRERASQDTRARPARVAVSTNHPDLSHELLTKGNIESLQSCPDLLFCTYVSVELGNSGTVSRPTTADYSYGHRTILIDNIIEQKLASYSYQWRASCSRVGNSHRRHWRSRSICIARRNGIGAAYCRRSIRLYHMLPSLR